MNDSDVIVIGAGTTGLGLAKLLDMEGVSVTVVDPTRIVAPFPRGSHIDAETMRTIQTLGLGSAEQGYMAMDGVEGVSQSGEILFRWEMEQGTTAQGWKADYQFFQPDFEAALRGQLALSERADLLLGWRMEDIRDVADGVEVGITHRETGATQVLRARYAVGCDGARSKTRGHVTDVVEDLDGTRLALIVDIRLFGDVPAHLPARTTRMMSGARPVNLQPGIPPNYRFNFTLLGEDGSRFSDPREVYDYLSPWLSPDQYRIIRSDVYEWNAHLATGWSRGRLFIAGDAAHLMPPMLGQGMCSGLRDSANLAWKLARVIKGTSDESLLDSYESERRPHVRDMIIESKRQGDILRDVSLGKMDPADAAGQVIDRSRWEIGAGILHEGNAHAGDLAPQPRVGGTLLDDIVGYRFLLLVDQEVLGKVDPQIRQNAEDFGIQIVASEGEGSAWLASIEADAAVVRPDRYVFSATKGAEELEEALGSLFAQLTTGDVPVLNATHHA
jgi:3-(3-hydroxy-phenyl)propionate hydroxylase